MADPTQQAKVQQFRTIAGVNEDRARFYLDASEWNVDDALTSFFDDVDDGEGGASPQSGHQHHEPTLPSAAAQAKHPGKQGAAGKSTSSQSSRFATIGSLRSEESDSSGEEGQAYYAGGSERGAGQQIIGPSKKKKGDVEHLVSDMFRAAREHGAEVIDSHAGASSSGGPSAAFHGRAYRLGDDEFKTEVIEGAVEPDRPRVEMVLKLWQNGFSVDSGPLRDFDDPANKNFLQQIQRGEIPQELIQQARGGEVHLNMEDHRHEDYVKPSVTVQPFSGQGHRLGNPLDPVGIANTTAREIAGTKPTPSAAAGSSSEATAAAALNVDLSQPTTSLQIRLADGSRLIAKFNHTHRISDVRQYIITARPQYDGSSFILMTTFPNAELTDETQTLAAAKLLNAVLVQRMK